MSIIKLNISLALYLLPITFQTSLLMDWGDCAGEEVWCPGLGSGQIRKFRCNEMNPRPSHKRQSPQQLGSQTAMSF